MGYTIERGRTVIWTEKVFVSEKYPFNQEGENHTLFYKNLRDKIPIMACLSKTDICARLSMLKNAVPELQGHNIIFRSRKAHYNMTHNKNK